MVCLEGNRLAFMAFIIKYFEKYGAIYCAYKKYLYICIEIDKKIIAYLFYILNNPVSI